MHIRITFSSSYYEHIFSIDIPNMITYLGRTLKEEQNHINFLNKYLIKLV